jgi:hypothetical protein
MPTINEKFIKTLISPVTNHKIYWDDKITGLGIRITNNNIKSFVLRYVINARERKYTIGKYPELTSTAAREMAIKLKGEILNGNDPLEEREANNKAATFNDLATEYLKLSKTTKRPKTLIEYKSMLSKYILPKFGNYKLDTITRNDIEKLHSSLNDKIYRANRIIELLSNMFYTAISWGWTNNNPVKGIKKYTEEKRSSFLSENEIIKLLDVLNNEVSIINSSLIKLILLTGSRKGEILSDRWQDFNFENGTWLKPAALTKQNKMSYIPLNQEALEILVELRKNIVLDQDISKHDGIISSESHLFYNPKTKSHVKDIKRFWQKVSQKAGLSHYRIHDLRHTFASILVNSGVSLGVIAKLVGHSNTRTTERYSHLMNDTLKQATEILGNKINTIKK